MLHAAETISGIAAFSALIIFDGVCGGIGRQSAFIKIGFFAVAAQIIPVLFEKDRKGG